MHRCCPISCHSGVLSLDQCNTLTTLGTCLYPNYAQCEGKKYLPYVQSIIEYSNQLLTQVKNLLQHSTLPVSPYPTFQPTIAPHIHHALPYNSTYDAWNIYGLFNTGTNVVTQLLHKNCRSYLYLKFLDAHRIKSIHGQISNWKHRFFNDKDMNAMQHIKKIIMVKDPLTWFQSICVILIFSLICTFQTFLNKIYGLHVSGTFQCLLSSHRSCFRAGVTLNFVLTLALFHPTNF